MFLFAFSRVLYFFRVYIAHGPFCFASITSAKPFVSFVVSNYSATSCSSSTGIENEILVRAKTLFPIIVVHLVMLPHSGTVATKRFLSYSSKPSVCHCGHLAFSLTSQPFER